jgi:hypothetical protein
MAPVTVSVTGHLAYAYAYATNADSVAFNPADRHAAAVATRHADADHDGDSDAPALPVAEPDAYAKPVCQKHRGPGRILARPRVWANRQRSYGHGHR